MNYTYVPLPLVEEASSVSASAQVLVIDDGEVKRTDAANIGIKPTGKLTLTNTTETDCTNYAAVQIVDANLLAENIKKDVAILGTTGSYEGGGSSDFSTAEVTINLTVEGKTLVQTGGKDLIIAFPSYDFGYTLPYVWTDENNKIGVLLYQNHAEMLGLSAIDSEDTEYTTISGVPVCTGDISYSDGMFVITGSGTITATLTE